MYESLERIKKIAFQFKKIEEEEQSLNKALLKIKNEQDKLESAYTKITNKSQENSIIMEELDNDITNLKEKRDTVIGYKEFKTDKKQKHLLQVGIIIVTCGVLTSPLVFIEPITYLEFMSLSTALIGTSNLVQYFNDIRQNKELVKSTDMNKLINNINKRERQKEIAECVLIKLDVKKVALTNKIDNFDNEKKHIINHLKYLNNCKMGLIEQLSKEFGNTPIEDSIEFNCNDLCIKLKAN